MGVRRRRLPPGWYPETAEQARGEIQNMEAGVTRARVSPGAAECAGIMPHAGWHFSGRLALEVLSFLCRGIDTMVIIGGHMGSSDGIVAVFDDEFETPLGPLPADPALLQSLRGMLDIREDRERDNTVEVHLPLVRYLAPDVRVVGLRAPPGPPAEALGKAVAAAASALGRKVAVAGSTDLTHYGENYGFSPAGSGPEALRWMREVNDRRIVESMIGLDIPESLSRARRERSACSIGGAVAAISFARECGAGPGRLLGYMTSADVLPGASFVGYAGILYSRGSPVGA
jgi:hypothetical protein